jgi:hypothetical protein
MSIKKDKNNSNLYQSHVQALIQQNAGLSDKEISKLLHKHGEFVMDLIMTFNDYPKKILLMFFPNDINEEKFLQMIFMKIGKLLTQHLVKISCCQLYYIKGMEIIDFSYNRDGKYYFEKENSQDINKIRKKFIAECKQTGGKRKTLEDIYWNYVGASVQSNELKTNFNTVFESVLRKLDNPMVFPVTRKLIKYIYAKIDSVYFEGNISNYLEERYGADLLCEKNTKLTRTAGRFSFGLDGLSPILEIGDKIISSLFTKGEKSIKNGGYIINNRLSFLIRVIEHELCHLLTLMFQPKEAIINAGHGPIFRTFIKNTFGHTDYTHDGFAGDTDIADNMRDILKVGNKIKYHGKINIETGKVISLRKHYIEILLDSGTISAAPYGKVIEITDNSEKSHIDISKFKIGGKVSFKKGGNEMQCIILSFTNRRVKVSCDDGKKYYVVISAIKILD